MYLFSQTTIQQAKEKAAMTSWALAGWQAIEARAADFLHRQQCIPHEAGGWIHNYICLEHWLPIIFDGSTPGVHKCPAGHLCEGEKYDAAWRVWRHREITDLAREAGLAYRVMNSQTGRKVVIDILFQYADFYTTFDGLSDAEPWMLKGHAFNQALTEGLWAVPLIQAYDCVADTLTAEQKAQLDQNLWTPMQRVMEEAQDKLTAQDKVSNNYMAWLNVTLGLLGFTLQRQSLIERAIEAPAGFKTYLNLAVYPDNMEFEVTPYYHNFVVLADLILAEAAGANGIDLHRYTGEQGQSNLGMGKAVANLVWPDGSLPDISEGSYWIDSIYDPELCQVYEILYGQVADNDFAQLLQGAYSRENRQRDNWAALLYGRPEITIDAVEAAQKGNTFMAPSGLAQWRSAYKLAALATFGPYTGHHHQFDRLSLVVWPFAKDAGSPLYALPARKAWYPHSYAHNTLVVNGESHGKCGGELSSWDGNRLHMCVPDAYPDVQLERITEMDNGVIVDELTAEATTEHTFDWVFHVDGEVTVSSEFDPLDRPLAEDGPGAFIHLNGTQVIQDSVICDIRYEDVSYQLYLRCAVPFTLFVGDAPGTSRTPTQRRTVLIGRTVGEKQTYSMVIKQMGLPSA